MTEVFELSARNYNLRTDVSFATNNIRTMNYGLHHLSSPKNMELRTLRRVPMWLYLNGKIKTRVPWRSG